MNKIYEIKYIWQFKKNANAFYPEEIFGDKDEEYLYAISAHNKKDAVKWFKENKWEDEHSIVLKIVEVKVYSIEEYLYKNMDIERVNKEE